MSQPERKDRRPAANAPERATSSPRPALSLVPRPVASPRHSPLALWHLLSLDAPSVAALWTFAIAQTVGLHLPWTGPAAMFVAVWMLYVADRLLDARPLPNGDSPPELEERHRFHHRHRRALLFAILVASIALAALLHTLDPRALHLYALLAALLGAYLLLIHAHPLHTSNSHRLPKELAVGIFFPAAVFIPTVARLPQLRLGLLAPALLFAAVCTLNCLLVYAWEHPGSRPHAHWTTRWGTGHLTSLAVLIIAASLAVILTASLASTTHLSPQLQRSAAIIASCTLLSSLLLLLLNARRRHLKPVHLRALADLVLLTPLLTLPVAHLLAR